MKKLALILLCILVVAGIAAAQTYSQGATGLTGRDVLGAHNNGGRGCAGCHAPHSGGKGGGGNAATNATAFNDPFSGDDALFGQDVTPIYGLVMNMGDGGRYIEVIPAASASNVGNYEIRGIAMCLACHDGNVATGGMMTGVSYEKQMGLLPAGLYGPNPIPTWLGNDGSTAGNYQNDHPVGVNATLGALRLVTNGNPATDPIKVTIVNGAITALTAQNATYVAFANNYGYPALANSAWDWGVWLPSGSSDPTKAFITCLTCHNQHVMYIYKPPSGKQASTNITSPGASATYPTYFFVNAPYNPGAGNADPTKAASTTQFCRQCHIGEANESFGVNNVATKY